MATNHTNRRIYYLSFVLLLLASLVYAGEKNDYLFRTFSPEGGFYYDGVTAVEQDKDGFVWILMDNNLYRFDGYQYKRYHTYFQGTDFSRGRRFYGIATDSVGKLFVGTSNGLYEYNGIADSFRKKSDAQVTLLKIDALNNLWVGQSEKFGKYNPENDSLTVAQYEGEDIANINSFDGDGDAFFVSTAYSRIYRGSHETPEYSLFYAFPWNYRILKINIRRDKLWVLVDEHGLFRIDIPTAAMEEKLDFFYENNTNKAPVRTFRIDKNGTIWIAAQNGLYTYHPGTKTYTHHLHSGADTFSLPNNSVWCIDEDRQRNIWIGTYSGGLCYVNLDETKAFESYTPKESRLNSDLVSSFAETGKYIWVGTEGDGLNRIDKQSGDFSYFQYKPGAAGGISSNNIKSMVLGPGQDLWIATFRGGLNHLDTGKEKFRHIMYEKDNKNSLRSNDLRKIVAESDKGLWIAYQQSKLVVSFYSFDKQSFTHYYFNEQDSNHFIFDICRGNGNRLWIITHNKLHCMNTLTGSAYDIPPIDSLYMGGQTVCTDKEDNVWIGTIGRGLIKYNPETSAYTEYGDILKLNASSIYSLCTDDDDNLWMGTDNGLFKYDIESDRFFRFDKTDGVQGQVFYPLSAFKSKDGKIYFGGTNGFTIVSPGDVVQNLFRPKVVISDFFIDNNPANHRRSDKHRTEKLFSFPDEVTLNYKQADFGFRFSSDNYLVPEKNRFRYRLKGYDTRWIEVDAFNRNAFYAKVPPGKYTFEVVASNNDGVWSDTPTTVRIKRLPAPWLSWYAYVLYFLLVAGISFVVIKHYEQQKKLKLKLYLDRLDKEKKEEIHQSQLRFFTNISHDFRTPLSLILASLEKLRQEGLKEDYYRMLYGNSRRLLNLVNELMDFRKIENEKMPLHVEPVDVNRFMKELAFYFEDYAKQHKKEFRVITDPSLPTPLYVDKSMLEKIVMNLLNNAFKYTGEGGFVQIETYGTPGDFVPGHAGHYTVKGETYPQDSFIIAVRDSGVGVSKESIATVFERFYKVKTVNFDSHLGTGIGLALVKSLVLLHKGEISIYSERGKGTDMVVRLSKVSGIYGENEFLQPEKEETGNTPPLPEPRNRGDETDSETVKDIPGENIMSRDKKRVMLVEDNDDLRALIADYLSADYDIVEANNGLVASNLLQNTETDLIISDIMMPVKDGMTLCREVKEDINFSHIPFILLTARTSLESKLEGAGSGADVYFEKPVDFNLLRLSVQNIFKRQQQLKEHYAKNYFADSSELSTNKQDNKFLKKLIEILEANLDQPELDVNYIASELSMSRSKLYTKIKSMTDKSIVEFITGYKLRKAARLIVEENLTMREVMDRVGIESQSYFTRAFKKEFGETPTAFAAKRKRKK